MKIHEYQAREILSKAGVAVPAGRVVETAAEAELAFGENGAERGGGQVVKAQVFAGGRGKAGFVRLVKSAAEARAAAEFMLTHKMVSAQTGAEGIAVKKVLVAAAVEIEKEYYVAITLDRGRGEVVVIASAEGGVEIEEVAQKHPTAIIKEPVHPLLGLSAFAGLKVAKKIGLGGKQALAVAKVLVNLSKIYFQFDASMVEINPLVVTKRGEVVAVDAKMMFDDNALFRQLEIVAMKDEAEMDPLEVQAKAANLNYIRLDGQIGCVVNGAGLAMATMDVIGLFGGRPANFLDVGGGVSANGAKEAFRIILADAKVKGILVNIFGGIAKCDVIAQALIEAGKEIGFTMPLVVRLEGTNVERARELLNAAYAELPTLQTAVDLNDAAERIVKSSNC